MIPNADGIDCVNRVIYEELCLGKISTTSKQKCLQIIEQSKESSAEGIILGCTEMTLLIQPQETSIPVFDTTAIHAEAVVEFAIAS